MGGNLETIDRAAVESLMDWWRMAGVDLAVGEMPCRWLRGDEPEAAVVAFAPPAPTETPKELGEFQQWLAGASGLPMDRPGSVRILPTGPAEAPVMVMSDMPDRDDAAAGRCIGGDAGTLLGRMLKAIGIESDAAYHASMACFHAPGARIGRDELERCAAIARDHIRLAKPQRLVLFGDAPSRALLDEPLARARGRIHKVEGVRTIATFHPRWLLQRPSDKSLAWRDLQLLMSESE